MEDIQYIFVAINLNLKNMQLFTSSIKNLIFTIIALLGAFLISQAQTFEYKDSGTDFILYDLSIPEGQNSVAYAAGSKFTFDTEGIILKSEDAGETWEKIYPLSGTSPSFEKIEFVSTDKGFVAGYNLFMKTEDGGATWTPMTVGTNVYLYNNLSFFNENIGFVSAQLDNAPYFAIYLTTDGGDTWTPATDVMNAGGFDVAYADQNTLFSVGADERIAKSTDGGDTWIQIYSGIIQNYFLSAYFKDQNNGVIAGEDGLLKTTHDGGATWSDFATGYHHFYALAYKGDQLLAGGTDTDIYISDDNGDNWSQIFMGNDQNQLYEIEFFEDGSGLIVGSGGIVIKFEDVFLGTEDNQFSENDLVSFYNSTSKTFSIQSKTEKIEKVAIYNITGQHVGSFTSNSNTFDANVSAYANGVYLVTVTSNNQTSSLKFLKQ
ncbi:putative photosystem II stability/assembly factor-like protein [Aequorivita sublithincola DSM 14238]|uniref:Putative photosystem II stability/assembly factor-like protein n=1 Tax=Aequorivita sublithincola (strain DSM 14238 / LMG 21431 / ACAM 643 / 9-3) TaxID=746697 RepID=I3YSZ8_AEQSU|nr:YCF48-related protein [Aequorivita sublithincola]AFL80116.1 putative photosystem II stability/assembly factor-like protein [Aequorivita sublithincola DSM 14238]